MALSGGAKVVFEIANRFMDKGDSVDIFSYSAAPTWFPLRAAVIPQKDPEDVPWADYDFIVICLAFMLPVILPFISGASAPRAVFYCLDYESFHHARGAGYEDFVADDPTFVEIYKLPVPIVTISRAVQTLIRERVGCDAYHVPPGVDKAVFLPRPLRAEAAIKRVVMVGNYLMPYKGMADAFEALTELSRKFPVELVLVTSETRNRKMLESLPFPVEVHRRPQDCDMSAIISSCDVLCCASWYEGLGLPALEAMHCGVPAVSTRNYGVADYGIDGVNLLLADPHDPADLARALERILTDHGLALRLREEGFRTAGNGFHWSHTIDALRLVFDEIASAGPQPSVDPETLHSLARRMEQQGNYTPIAIGRRYRELTDRLHQACESIAAGGVAPDAGVAVVRDIVAELSEFIDNPGAEYYGVFRAEYDFARLAAGLAGHPRMQEALRALMNRRKTPAAAPCPSIREVIYEVA